MPYDINYIVMDSASKMDWPAWFAVVISILALFTTLWQAHLGRVHNRLSVRPLLEGHTHDENGVYSLEVRNDGLGPAILTGVRVTLNNQVIEGEGPSLIQRAIEGVPGCKLIGHELFYPPFVLPAGESIQVCQVAYSPEIGDVDLYLAGRVSLQIDYESAYKEKCPMYQSRRPAS